MNKFVLCFFCFLSAMFCYAEPMHNIYEKYSNDAVCQKIEEHIFLTNEVETAAVVKYGKTVICGILCGGEPDEEKISELKNFVHGGVKQEAWKAEKILVEINSKKARDIAELGYYASKGVNKKILFKRFEYLTQN